MADDFLDVRATTGGKASVRSNPKGYPVQAPDYTALTREIGELKKRLEQARKQTAKEVYEVFSELVTDEHRFQPQRTLDKFVKLQQKYRESLERLGFLD